MDYLILALVTVTVHVIAMVFWLRVRRKVEPTLWYLMWLGLTLMGVHRVSEAVHI